MSFLFITEVFVVDSLILNLAASVTCVSLLASTQAGVSIFCLIEIAVLFCGSLFMMVNESQPKIEVKLLPGLIAADS
jgi:hypothetical protein